MEIKTKYAPSGRKAQDQVFEDYMGLINEAPLKVLLDSLPYMCAILNEERQAVYVNEKILDFLGITDIAEILGERPGEFFGCMHANKEAGGCGTSENCRVCGAVNSILKAQLNGSKVVEECRITSSLDGKRVNFDLQITATPVRLVNKDFIILALEDISNLKRKEVLEKIFLHDILNLSNNLQGFVELLHDLNNREEIGSFLDQISNMVAQLNDEIVSQRELLAAEKGELAINLSDFEIMEFLPEVIQAVSHHNTAIGKEIVLTDTALGGLLQTDKALFTRVVINMIKNALEAESLGGTVYVNSSLNNGYFYIRVKNSAVIPQNVKLQIFQRSFSTKGSGRGIGTYSMKLITGQYLKGTISFISNSSEGTIFTLQIPQRHSA